MSTSSQPRGSITCACSPHKCAAIASTIASPHTPSCARSRAYAVGPAFASSCVSSLTRRSSAPKYSSACGRRRMKAATVCRRPTADVPSASAAAMHSKLSRTHAPRRPSIGTCSNALRPMMVPSGNVRFITRTFEKSGRVWQLESGTRREPELGLCTLDHSRKGPRGAGGFAQCTGPWLSSTLPSAPGAAVRCINQRTDVSAPLAILTSCSLHHLLEYRSFCIKKSTTARRENSGEDQNA